MGIGTDQFQTTPTLYETVRLAVEQRLAEIFTVLPGKIVSYEAAGNVAVVQPTLKVKYRDEAAAKERPVIAGVRVQFPKMGNSWLRLPVNPGDEGLLVFSQRSIERWQALGGVQDPEDPRKFSYSDCFFQPGATSDPETFPPAGAASSAEFVNDRMLLELLPTGKLKMQNDTGEIITQLTLAFETLGKEPLLAGAPIYLAVAQVLGSFKANGT